MAKSFKGNFRRKTAFGAEKEEVEEQDQGKKPESQKARKTNNIASLNFKVTPEFRAKFKATAALKGLKLNEFLELCFEEHLRSEEEAESPER